MDANTYYLNQHMDAVNEYDSWQDRAEWIAKQEMDDPMSNFYPWTSDRISEAMNEAPQSALERMVASHGNDRALATVVREIVLGYWLETATEHFLSQPRD
jgi:hypothetical protein